MADKITGIITNIVDENTFDIMLSSQDSENEFKYNSGERIKIGLLDIPELRRCSKQISKELLESHLSGKKIICFVEGRDEKGNIIAFVQLEKQ